MASTSTTTPKPTSRMARTTVLLLMCVVACGQFNRVGISVAGTERIIPAYGISTKQMGSVYSAFLLFYTLAMFPGGWFIDRFGARRALLLMGFAATVFIALSGCVGLVFHEPVTLLAGLLVVRSLLGSVYAPLHPGAARMVADELPADERPRALGWINFSACLGIAATQFVLGTLIDRFDWQAALLLSSVLSLVVAIIWMGGTSTNGPGRRETGELSKSIDPKELWQVMRQRSVIGITISYAAYGYFQYLFFYWISYYFETVQHQDRVASRGYTTTITLAMGAGMICGGWLMSQVPARFSPWARRAIVPMVGMLASGAVFELGLLASNPQATIAAFILSAGLLGLCEAAFWTTAVELGGPYGGSAAGLMNTGGNAGGALSPYLTPLLSDVFARQSGADAGWRLALAAAGIIVFAGGALWMMVHAPNHEGGIRQAEA